MICSSGANRGTDLFGRECFHFDGRTYRPAGYTNEGHYRGAMVAFSIYNQDNNGVWNIGGEAWRYDSELFWLETFKGNMDNPEWEINRNSEYMVGVYGFTAVTVHYNHFLGQQNNQIMLIFGGMSDDNGFNEDVFFINGQGSIRKHPQKLLQNRREHSLGVFLFHSASENDIFHKFSGLISWERLPEK